MRIISFLLITLLSFSSCNGQEKQKNSTVDQKPEIAEKEPFVPKGSWTVNKELDENGNIIKYDSIYSYSYGTMNGDTINIEDVDSVMQSFRNYFNNRMPSVFDEELSNRFWDRPRLEEGFFEDDFFNDRWSEDLLDVDRMMKQMDSLRAQYFQDFYPRLYERKSIPSDSIK